MCSVAESRSSCLAPLRLPRVRAKAGYISRLAATVRKNILERTWRPVDTECNLVLLLELPWRRDNAVRREQDSAHGLLTHESHLQRLPAEGELLVADSIVALHAVLARQRNEVPVRAVLGAHEIHRGHLLSDRGSFIDDIPTRHCGIPEET